MASDSAFRKAWVWLLLVLAGVGGTLVVRHSLATRHPPRILITKIELEGEPGSALGFGRLIQDMVEVESGATVLVQDTASDLSALPEDFQIWRVTGRREGSSLTLRLEWAHPNDLIGTPAWQVVSAPASSPSEALVLMLSKAPLPDRFPVWRSLAPTDAVDFWTLVEAMSVEADEAALAQMGSSQALSRHAPMCPAVWTNLGEQLYRLLWAQPAGGAGESVQNQAVAALDRALLLAPGYPRAALLRGMVLSDIGNQRSALIGLMEARSLRPSVPDLYAGLAYAGRTVGLLEGARRALDHQRALIQPLFSPPPWFAENTYLYQGDWARFDEEIRASIGRSDDPVFRFYEGYLGLLRNDRGAAQASFARGASIQGNSVPFRDLCAIYQAIVEGRQAEALAKLEAFETSRGALRIPDGELTFKVAEAYAQLGSLDRAMDAAQRAYAQGFCCLRWYDQSPLLKPVRARARWMALHQHLEERQREMSEAFPVSDFD